MKYIALYKRTQEIKKDPSFPFHRVFSQEMQTHAPSLKALNARVYLRQQNQNKFPLYKTKAKKGKTQQSRCFAQKHIATF